MPLPAPARREAASLCENKSLLPSVFAHILSANLLLAMSLYVHFRNTTIFYLSGHLRTFKFVHTACAVFVLHVCYLCSMYLTAVRIRSSPWDQ